MLTSSSKQKFDFKKWYARYICLASAGKSEWTDLSFNRRKVTYTFEPFVLGHITDVTALSQHMRTVTDEQQNSN